MADLYGDFDDSDDLEGNDEDIGALGSLLSWDEEDEQQEGSNTNLPGLVSFAVNKDQGMYGPQMGLGENANLVGKGGETAEATSGISNGTLQTNEKLQLPLPTRIGYSESQQTQPAIHQTQQQFASNIQPQQQQQAPQQQQMVIQSGSAGQGDLNQATTYLYQQNGPILQPAPNAKQPMAIQPALPSMVMPAMHPQPTQQVQTNGQPQQVVQFQYSGGDPNLFFRQLQVAQYQQQLNAARGGPLTQRLLGGSQPQAIQLQQKVIPQQQQSVLQPQTMQAQTIPQQTQTVPQQTSQQQTSIQQQQQQSVIQQQQQNALQQQQQQQQNALQQQQQQQLLAMQQHNAMQRQQQNVMQQQQQNVLQQQQQQQQQQNVLQQQQQQQQNVLQQQQQQQQQQQNVLQQQQQQQQNVLQQQQQQQQTVIQSQPQGQQGTVQQSQPQGQQGTVQQSQQQMQQYQRARVHHITAPSGAFPSPTAQYVTKAKPPQTQVARTRTESGAQGIVSSSDTDGELSSRRKPTTRNITAPTVAGKKRKASVPEPQEPLILNPESKAKANRDRNREHARNTRLRKKAYLEKLKTTVDDLCKERDTLVSERAGAASLLVEMHNTRTEVLMSFFALRSANEKRRKLWASILDESCFSGVMPVTPYRSFPASEVQISKCQRTILGIDGMMADTVSLHVLLSSLVDRSKYPYKKIEFSYTLVTEEAVVAGNQMMARWVMSTTNAKDCGARMEVAKQGMLCCRFNSAHRITGLELMFDVMALMLQLKQATGSDSFSVIPNTVQTCQRSFDKPIVMILADNPYTIVQVNQLWERMTGYTAEEVVGKNSTSILHGLETEKDQLEELMSEIRFKRTGSAMLINYTKAGHRFRHYVIFYPLSTDSRITHYLGLTYFMQKLSVNEGTIVEETVSTTNALSRDKNRSSGSSGETLPSAVDEKRQESDIGTSLPPMDRGAATGVATVPTSMLPPPTVSSTAATSSHPHILPTNSL